MSELAAGPTMTFEASRSTATASFVAAGRVPRSGFDDELCRVLRSRLILIHLLALAYVLLLMVLSFVSTAAREDISLRPDQGNPWRLVPLLLVCVVGAATLWIRPGMSLRSLRLWELIFFAFHAGLNGHLRFDMLAFAGGGAPDPSSLEIAFRGVVSLTGFITLILAYGVLIPNNRRRSMIVVIAMTVVPFGAIAVATAVNPALRWSHFVMLNIQAALTLVFPAAIAVFAAARANNLQRRAFEAEQRAAQVGQYTLQRKLGEGGMGEVWLAEHRLLKRPCAVKFVRPELSADPRAAARFEREVRAVTGLAHINTIRVYDYGRSDDGSFYYVMEYLDGPTLEALVEEAGPLPAGRVVCLLRQVCGALSEAHAAGLVHRDLKPGNVIVATLGGQRDVAKLLDFGLVQDLSADVDGRLTRAGTVLGTPAYMSPEQAAGEAVVDVRGDVYSLGGVAFFALAGRPPFLGRTLGQLLAAHRGESPPALTDLRPEVPADLAAIVARCLAKDPNDRFQSVSQLDRALAMCKCGADWSAEQAAQSS